MTINRRAVSIHPPALLVPRFQGSLEQPFPIVSGRFRPRRRGPIFLQCTSPPAPPIGGSPLTFPTLYEYFPRFPLNPSDTTLMDPASNVAKESSTAFPR